ncbi:glycosyltransferase family 1 protein [Pseudarthrobacter enclensis]|uniref:rhamnosyltransferase WsaF family glycosyltransferase n=1 Tax=Pseudarthrobacter enclensis TaxID=993070 RepID=UPI0036D0229B
MTETRVQELVERIRTHGAGEFGRRAVRRLSNNLAVAFATSALDFPLLRQDVADSTTLCLAPPPERRTSQEALNLAWLCTPPGPGSGGHTTLFRMVKGMEDRGHKCTLLLYDRHGTNMSRAVAIVREYWPWLHADIRVVPAFIQGFDGCVASSWETAHVLARRSAAAAIHRFYFIQDYEPFFYPRGSLYSLAEDSYQLGFTHIALGNMVADALFENAGVSSSAVPFGCDGDTYVLDNYGTRSGVVFYARESVDRRGTLLGELAMEDFHRRHPEQPIHVYGDPLPLWQVPHHHHGKLSPVQLNRLYNQCLAGLALSFTNISLVAEEMLSCGMAPIVNDHPFARKDLGTPGVRWAPATPGGIAEALCRAVEDPPSPGEAAHSASSARKSWELTKAKTAAIIEAQLFGGLQPRDVHT